VSTGSWFVRGAGAGPAALALLVAAASGCIPATGATCDQDDQCPVGYHCGADSLCIANGVAQDAGRADATAADLREADRTGGDRAAPDRAPTDRAAPDSAALDQQVTDAVAVSDANRRDASAPDLNGLDLIQLPGTPCSSNAQCSTSACNKGVCCAQAAISCGNYECYRCTPGSGLCVADEGTPCQIGDTRNCNELIYGVYGSNCVAYASLVIGRRCQPDGTCGQIELVSDCANHRTPGVEFDWCGSVRCLSDSHVCFADTLVADYSHGGLCAVEGVTDQCTSACYYSGMGGYSLEVWSCDTYGDCLYDSDASPSCGLYACRNNVCLTNCTGDPDCYLSSCRADGGCQ